MESPVADESGNASPNIPVKSPQTKETVLAAKILKEFNITEESIPVDMDPILKKYGFTVKKARLPESLATVLDTREDAPVLLLDESLDDAETRVAKAHCLGHVLMDADFKGIRTDGKKNLMSLLNQKFDEEERSADLFAVSLILPMDLVAKQLLRHSAKGQSDKEAAETTAGSFGVGLIIFLLVIAFFTILASDGGKESK